MYENGKKARPSDRAFSYLLSYRVFSETYQKSKLSENALFFGLIDGIRMIIDSLFISDSLSELHHSHLIKAVNKNYYDGFNKPLFLNYKNIIDACLISIDSFPEDCITKSGIIKARKQFLNAVKYSVHQLKTDIILLAASTKRLFGKNADERVNTEGILISNGFTLSEYFPDILFTNGDNGTALILEMEIEAALKKIKMINEPDVLHLADVGHLSKDKIIVINGLGLLGMSALEYLIDNNINDEQIIVISNYTKDLKALINGRDIKLYQNLKLIEKEIANNIELIINCTHNSTNLIDYEAINHIQNGQQINVIDVAVPYGFPEEEFLKCKNINRQDGGNAYIENGLEFFFNPEICGLTENVLYGCFAETVVLAAYLKANPNEILNLKEFDFFNVNHKTKKLIKTLFEKYKIGISPVPYNFNKRMMEEK
ncbi:MAG: hypothetical protein NT007_14120 [Candidatus Kapabacteria bacterium]|nr:hypothetical protein [Candidatus Kapabacteria bacterium]